MKKELNILLSRPSSYYKNSIIKNSPKFNFNKPVVLFGAAKMGLIYIELCKKNKIKLIAFCDNDNRKNNTYLNNVLIVNPLTLRKYFNKDIQIIITSLYDEEIRKQLYKLGFRKVWNHTYFSTLYARNFSILSWTNYINDITNNKDNIIKCFNYLKDTISKKTFVEILKYRLTLNRKHINKVANISTNIYFDKNIINLTKDEVFLDGGAYNGDTINPFIKQTKGMFKKVFCFEPDFESYSILKRHTEKEIKDARIKVLPYGLGKKEETVFFTNEGNLQSKIIKSGKVEIKLYPVDKYIKKKFTLIKLDIEGYEKEALLGAKKTIKVHKPKLAICIYHYLKDLWEIPLLIKRLNPEYNIFIRHYNEFLFDTVCYAV